MLNAPPLLEQQIEQLTQYIRCTDGHSAPEDSVRTRYYRHFIRENIKDVVKHSFPKFCSCLDANTIDTLVNSFIKIHKAIEPEFHHIATEFVRFIQSHYSKHTVLLSLLEYEWVLFSVEIDSDRVISSSMDLSKESLLNLNPAISLNPTLQYIKLPFSLSVSLSEELTGSCPIACGDFYYVLFRDTHHRILKKSIEESDYYFLNLLAEQIAEHQSAPFKTIKSACEKNMQTHFVDWLIHSKSTDLIISTLPGEHCD